MITLNKENRLYYYCSLDTAIRFILADKQLRLGPIQNTNDPREYKDYRFGTISIGAKSLQESDKEISEELRGLCKVICFTQDYGHSFHGYESSRMWAYYGGGHQGVCLLLDKEKFLEENKDIINVELLRDIKYFGHDVREYVEHKRVDYTQIDKIGKERYLKEVFIPENIEFLFLTKNKEWESEHEKRLLHITENQENEYCSIKSSLKSVFLGVDFERNNLPSIKRLCPNIDIFQLEFEHVRLHPFVVQKSDK